jgi:hydrogenase/urease accessory protein HupE
MKVFRVPVAWLAVIVPGVASVPAAAHDLRPVLVEIAASSHASQHHVYTVELRWPSTVVAFNAPEIQWPAPCVPQNESNRGSSVARRILLVCSEPLDGALVSIVYPILNPALSTLLRFTSSAGETHTAVLAPERQSWTVPTGPHRDDVARSYLTLGVEHIWLGVDHLLFVLGLLLLAKTVPRVLLTITGFTIGHSITLSIATLGFATIPIPPVEAAIALSIAFLAREIVLADARSLVRRHPMAVSTSFGLLHGLGFAAALADVGVPDTEAVAALLFFNIGVEAGQVAFVGLLIGSFMVAKGLCARRDLQRMEIGIAYGIGTLAVVWLAERVHGF